MEAEHNLSGLMKFATTPDWRAHLNNTFADHLGPAMIEFGLTRDAIARSLGTHLTAILWSCAFEDLASRNVERPSRNLIDDYLKRRGWRETAATKGYLRALRGSVISIYEVSNVKPGESFLARDLIRGGDRVHVHEPNGSKTLKQWDRISARILNNSGRTILSGGVLSFPFEAADTLLGIFGASNAVPTETAVQTDRDFSERKIAPIISTAWLSNFLRNEGGTAEPPALVNRDNNEVISHRAIFRIIDGASAAAVISRLNRAPELRPAKPNIWSWIGFPIQDGQPNYSERPALNIALQAVSVEVGRLELRGDILVLSVNSAERAEKGIAYLSDLLIGLIGKPLTSIRTLDQIRQASRKLPVARPPTAPSTSSTEILHKILDQHYEDVLSQPIPVLGNITPRLAATTSDGRKQVVKWLKLIENRASDQSSADDPMATYNFEWIWRELDVLSFRC